MTCPHCDSDHLPTFLGVLGVLAWFRCRMCGGEFDAAADEIDIPEQPE
jgi:hypothetical protein